MKAQQMSLFDLAAIQPPAPKPAPLVTPEEAYIALTDLKYGERLALDATIELLEACRKTREGAITSLAEGLERARQMRYAKTLYPKSDCLQWYEFIAHHPAVFFGAYLPSNRLYQRAEMLLTAVHQAANGYMKEARCTIGLDEWQMPGDEDEATK